MSTPGPADTHRPSPTVFLSYASEDRKAAQTLRDALPAFGLEVWYDESGLTGGDAWDQKIRRQIRECDFFMALVSAQTEVRPEGYFRREWRLAVERTLDMADDHTFLLPVVIDDTPESGARVPDKFLTVQWTRAPGGQPNAALEALCRRLVSGQGPAPAASSRRAPIAQSAEPRRGRARAPAREYAEFPRQEPGHSIPFWLRVAGWFVQSIWVFFNRLPRWVQVLAYLWLFIVLLTAVPKGCSSDDGRSGKLSAADARKLADISRSYQGDANGADATKLGMQIAQSFADKLDGSTEGHGRLLAIPFSAPSADPAARKLASTAFAQLYGRMVISNKGHVRLSPQALSSPDPAAAVARGREQHSKYVLFGAVAGPATQQQLTVTMVEVADGSVLWSKSYPVAGADPEQIASEAASKAPTEDDDD